MSLLIKEHIERVNRQRKILSGIHGDTLPAKLKILKPDLLKKRQECVNHAIHGSNCVTEMAIKGLTFDG